jgi:hypothetical protein
MHNPTQKCRPAKSISKKVNIQKYTDVTNLKKDDPSANLKMIKIRENSRRV